MLKGTYNARGSKMIINTGHKTFDRQVVSIIPGNTIGGGVRGNFIRPVYAVRNGFVTLEPGSGQRYDINCFHHLPQSIANTACRLADHYNGVILYEFYHIRNRQRITHGYIITTTGDPCKCSGYKILRTMVTGGNKSRMVIAGVAPYVGDPVDGPIPDNIPVAQRLAQHLEALRTIRTNILADQTNEYRETAARGVGEQIVYAEAEIAAYNAMQDKSHKVAS